MLIRLLPLVLTIYCCTSNETIEKVYYNGVIWTGDKDNPMASAIWVDGDKIQFVGTDDQVLKRSKDHIEKIDLGGRFVTPGFIDNHVHFMSGGLQLSRVDLRNVKSKKEFQELISKADNELNEGTWMQGGNWDHELWGGQYPDRSWIDEVVSNRPVFLDRLDGHMGLANSKALSLANITGDTDDPIGGIILKNSNGQPTGILKDLAMGLCIKLIPEPSSKELDLALKKATEYALSLGVTQVHDMGSWTDLQTYKRNHSKDELNIRIKIYPWYTNWKNIIQNVRQNGTGDEWLRWDGIKGMMDGSLGSRTAWMHRPYLPETSTKNKEILPTVGIITLDDTTDFKYLLRETDKADIQHTVHAIGDKANDWILEEYAKIREELGEKDRRSRIEHSQHLSPSAIERFAKDDIIPSMQPYHLYDDGSWAHKRIGYDLLSRTYIFRSLIDSGANLTFGSDWTVAPLDPVKGIYAAVTRRTRDGKNPDGWFPNEKISVEEALMCYTINNAYAAFWEKTTGSIAAGKYADFVVHSSNLLTASNDELFKSKVMRTVIAGKDHIFE
tara:strand:+ start:773 stop:2440 length:1668 start_codon:yes stop_codon:yes gene_type:complete